MTAVLGTTQNHSISPRVRKWTRAEFYAMARAGLFDEISVELIEGEVIDLAPTLGPHALSVALLADLLHDEVGPQFCTRVQSPLRCGEKSDPLPDIVVARGRNRDYPDHPQSSDVVLVVEVSETSLRYDRGLKLSMYAGAWICEYWIVNIPDRRIEVYTQPKAAGGESSALYASQMIYVEGETVSPLFAPALKGTVTDVLPSKSHE